MTTLDIFFNNGSFLEIDLINKFMRRALNYISPKEIKLKENTDKKKISIPSPHFDFEYIFLFYTLNYSDIPENYITHFKNMNSFIRATIVFNIASKYKLRVSSLQQLSRYSSGFHKQIVKVMRSYPENMAFRRLFNIGTYFIDTLRDVWYKKGLIITFSGVDGAGKSTILNEIHKVIKSKYRKKVVVFRHRPSILPILSAIQYGKTEAEQRSISRLPRTGTNTSILSSFLRFLYYYTDYLFGQFYVYAKFILRGYVVLYDRYYFDFINDPKRSNILINSKLIKFLYNLIYKPEINVFLHASPHIITKRKRELKSEDIVNLTKSYHTLFDNFSKKYKSSKYLSIENININRTVNTIMNEYVEAV